jgi:hypothetical protein
MSINLTELALALLWSATAPAAVTRPTPPARDFTYPGSAPMVRSPTGKLSITVARRSDDDPWQLRLFRGAQIVGTHEFDRWVDGNWSPSGRSVFVNDYEGSDTFDCLIPETRLRRSGFLSLATILQNNPSSGPVGVRSVKPPETPRNSHYYLTCQKWVDDTHIDVRLEGITLAGGQFSYALIFDTALSRFELAGH